MTCKDCEQYNKCEINPAEDEFICNDFKAKKKSKLKKILTIAGIAAGTGIVTGVLAYLKGRQDGNEKGFEKALTSPEVKLITNIKAYDAMSDYNEKVLYMVENGNFATEFINDDTGEKKYMTYTVSNKAPDWWENDDTQRFDLKEIVVNDLEPKEDASL